MPAASFAPNCKNCHCPLDGAGSTLVGRPEIKQHKGILWGVGSALYPDRSDAEITHTHIKTDLFTKRRSIFVVQSLSHVRLFATPWTVVHQPSLSFRISQHLLKLMSIESVMPSNYLTLCCPLLLLPSTFPSIRVFSNELALHIRWPKCWSLYINLKTKI